MIVIDLTEVRKDFKHYCDKVVDDCEPIIITRKDKGNVVMLSENEYNKILEKLYLRSEPEYYDMLVKSIEELKNGKHEKIDLKTLEEMGE